jgi:hypothetical protein
MTTNDPLHGGQDYDDLVEKGVALGQQVVPALRTERYSAS